MFAQVRKRVLVGLDSLHTHDHVLKEPDVYYPLVTRGSYCVVFDTIVENLPDEYSADPRWVKGNNPKTGSGNSSKRMIGLSLTKILRINCCLP